MLLFLVACIDNVPLDVAPRPAATEDRTVEDVFLQGGPEALDVLFLTDPDLGDQGVELADAFPYFLGWLLDSGIDYHVGVAPTDGGGALREIAGTRYLVADTPNPTQVFTGLVSLEGTGDGASNGLTALESVLSEPDGFRRSDADLRAVLVTEADDAGLQTVGDFSAWFESATAGVEATISGFVPEDATRYRTAISATGGLSFPTGEGFAAPLDELGQQVTGLSSEWFLTQVPLEPTLRVQVRIPITPDDPTFTAIEFEPATFDADGNLTNPIPEIAFEYNEPRNSVRLPAYVPEAGASVVVTYEAAE